MFSGSPERRHLADYFQRPLHSGDRVRGRLRHYSSTGESHTWNVKENWEIKTTLISVHNVSNVKTVIFLRNETSSLQISEKSLPKNRVEQIATLQWFWRKSASFPPNVRIMRVEMRCVMRPGPGWGWPKLALLFLLLINVTNGSEDWPCHMNLLKQHVIWKIHFNSGTQITEEF